MVEAISASGFRQRLATDPDLPLLDTRPQEDFEDWHIPGATWVRYAPGMALDRATLEAAIPSDSSEVLTVCGMGISSFEFANAVEDMGFPPVTVLVDGMVGWSRVYDRPQIDLGDGRRCWQLQRLAKGCLGYVLACDRTDRAVAIDVPIHLDVVTDLIEAEGLELELVIDTHIHADHVSGGPKLADTLDISYASGAKAADRGLKHEHEAIADGETISVGDIELHARATPGHTTDMLNFIVDDGRAMFTADTLFTDSVGRTELESPDAAAERARDLYRSITDILFEYPDSSVVLPGHYEIGGTRLHQPDTPMISTLGEIRNTVSLLSKPEDTFVETIADRSAVRPPNYQAIILVNLGGRPPPASSIITQLELGPNRCSATAEV